MTTENTLTLDQYTKLARVRMILHAEKAIEVLSYQLQTAKSPVRIAKLKSRILEYEQSLVTLKEKNAEETNQTSE